MSASRRIAIARRDVAIHPLKDGAGTALLLLPELGARALDAASVSSWAGPVFAFDPAGHGEADWLRGGGYTPELVAADADAALSELGPAAIVGHGLGAYAALLLAGARPDAVTAAVLMPGAGLDGGGSAPSAAIESWRGPAEAGRLLEAAAIRSQERDPHDPLLSSCTTDLRPLDYVEPFARAAKQLVFVEDESPRPEWWRHARGFENATAVESLASALVAAAR